MHALFLFVITIITNGAHGHEEMNETLYEAIDRKTSEIVEQYKFNMPEIAAVLIVDGLSMSKEMHFVGRRQQRKMIATYRKVRQDHCRRVNNYVDQVMLCIRKGYFDLIPEQMDEAEEEEYFRCFMNQLMVKFWELNQNESCTN